MARTGADALRPGAAGALPPRTAPAMPAAPAPPAMPAVPPRSTRPGSRRPRRCRDGGPAGVVGDTVCEVPTTLVVGGRLGSLGGRNSRGIGPRRFLRLGLARLGLAWLGLAWLRLAWLGLAWLGLAWLRVVGILGVTRTQHAAAPAPGGHRVPGRSRPPGPDAVRRRLGRVLLAVDGLHGRDGAEEGGVHLPGQGERPAVEGAPAGRARPVGVCEAAAWALISSVVRGTRGCRPAAGWGFSPRSFIESRASRVSPMAGADLDERVACRAELVGLVGHRRREVLHALAQCRTVNVCLRRCAARPARRRPWIASASTRRASAFFFQSLPDPGEGALGGVEVAVENEPVESFGMVSPRCRSEGRRSRCLAAETHSADASKQAHGRGCCSVVVTMLDVNLPSDSPMPRRRRAIFVSSLATSVCAICALVARRVRV